MSGAMSQRKGSGHELETKNDFLEEGYPAVKTGTYKADDILVTIGDQKLVLECKRRKNGFCSLYRFLKQSNADAVVHRDDYQEQLVTMPLKRLFSLLRMAFAWRGGR